MKLIVTGVAVVLALVGASCAGQSPTGPSPVKGSDGSKASVSLLSWRIDSCQFGQCNLTLTVQNNGPDCVGFGISFNGDFTLNGQFVYTAQWTLTNPTLGPNVRYSSPVTAYSSRMTVRQDYAFNPQISLSPVKCK